MFDFFCFVNNVYSSTVVSRRPLKSWSQLRQSVKTAHRRLSEISSKIPFGFNWCLTNENSIRLYFLSSLDNSPEITLLYCDIDLSQVASSIQITTNCNEEDLNEEVDKDSMQLLTDNEGEVPICDLEVC